VNIALTSACASNKSKSIYTQNCAGIPKYLQLRRGFGGSRVHFDFHGFRQGAFQNGVQRVQHGSGLRARGNKNRNIENNEAGAKEKANTNE
jgi:hypothetical protein